MRDRIVLGIDPGSVATGICVRRGRDALAHQVITRQGDEGVRGVGVGPVYLEQVYDAIHELAVEHRPTLFAIEGVVKPNPHMNRRNGKSVIDPGPIIGAAIVLGWVASRLPGSTVWVPPGKNGSLPLLAYPEDLVSAAERRHGLNRVGDGLLRHARSAYDVAGAAVFLAG